MKFRFATSVIRGLMFSTALVLGVAIPMSAQANFCWKDSLRPRRAGRCRTGGEHHCQAIPTVRWTRAFAYNKCDGGWDGKATICYQNCPSGYRDDGLFCAKQGERYRGAGYAIWDEKKCNKEHHRARAAKERRAVVSEMQARFQGGRLLHFVLRSARQAGPTMASLAPSPPTIC